ncbi:uncharacterized protein LOC141632335 [Silene latifolia]|uniref:uncharacterized protein LOC141632335 n=1 Tax=Silene latifolia TaxID=37657 RepID=UPI003D7866A9
MGKTPKIIEFLKRKNGHTSTNQTNEPSPNTTTTEDNETTHVDESRTAKIMRSLEPETNSYLVERNPGKRKQICQYPPGKRNEIRRAYILMVHINQCINQKTIQNLAQIPMVVGFKPHDINRAFIVDGFKNWKYAMGKEGAYNVHVGTVPNSPHQNAEKQQEDFLHQEGHLANIYAKQTPVDIAKNRLRLTSSIKALRWLTLQGLAMRGRDESENSTFYISSDIQIEILQIFRDKIKQAIRDEIGEHPFCIIVDEAGDVSGKQQLAIILRFVNNLGLVNESFFSIVHVNDTCASTLKKEIFKVKVMMVQVICMENGKGCKHWSLNNVLMHILFIVFAHRVQLALVAAAKDVVPIFQFFSKLSFVVSHILSSYKCVNELRKAYSIEIDMLIEDGELETGIGLNHASNL